MSLNNFLELLFDPADNTCFSPNPFGTEIKPWPDSSDVFFSINPMKKRRKDSNVTKFRNFLIEIDDMPLNEQENYVRSVLPVTSQVFSGAKSYHFIISLETPITMEEYKHTWLRVQKLLPQIDKACKNPSRFSRLPFRTRKETKLEQKLHYIGCRIKTEEFLAMLPELENDSIADNSERRLIKANLMGFCMNPDLAIVTLGLSGRNTFFYYLHERLKESGRSKEDVLFYIDLAYDQLKNKKDFSRKEAYNAARIRSK